MKLFKELKWDALLLAALYLLLGAVLLIFPETTAKTLGYSIGVILILAGALSMIMYLLRDAHQNYYHNDFVSGLIGIALGVIVLYKVNLIISLVPFILGLLVLISACSKLQNAIDMKRMGYGNWIVMLILTAVNAVLGIVLICNPFQAATVLFQVLGAGLIFSGITDLCTTIYFACKIREYYRRTEAVETGFEEVKDE